MKLYRHKRTGNLYVVIDENAKWEHDASSCVVYKEIDQTGGRAGVLKDQTWVRPKEEFFDGRFEPYP